MVIMAISKIKSAISESQHQTAIFTWRNIMAKQYPILELMYSTLNGVRLTISQARKAKREGNTKGVPDICLPCARKGYNGLYIELKKHGGRASAEQKEFIRKLEYENYKAVVCYGSIEAIDVIKDYVGIK
jgi:hypothetical protein